MSPIIFLILVATVATFGVLMAGGISMFKGGHYDATHAFPLMEARVILQALTVFLIVMAVAFW
jgi:hypothetical protein